MANWRLWILPLSPWQHELEAHADSLILHSELQLTSVKRMGDQAIVFWRRRGGKSVILFAQSLEIRPDDAGGNKPKHGHTVHYYYFYSTIHVASTAQRDVQQGKLSVDTTIS